MKSQLLSVGIDIGTTTTQVIFSKITLEIKGITSSIPETQITAKEIFYKSSIYYTPLVSGSRIDVSSLKEIVTTEYERSGIRRGDVSTGAIIITGETARKENAAEVVEHLSGFAGDFVVGTAGPDLEAVLAGWGAGAGELSKKHSGRIINFDIGGGTTNAAVFLNGEVVDSFALDIGGRLIKFDDFGCVSYVSERLEPVLKKLGIELQIGKKAGFSEILPIADRLAEMFVELVSRKDLQEDTKRLFICHQGRNLEIDGLMFSGGVSEYIYSTEAIDTLEKSAKFNDMGPLLGYCIRRKVSAYQLKVLTPREKIRATVVGAGNYSLELSGSTVACEDTPLPMKNIPVIKLFTDWEDEKAGYIGGRIRMKSMLYPEDTVAIAFKGSKSPTYHEIKEMAFQILEGTIKQDGPLIVMVENNFAKALGQTIRVLDNHRRPVICLDGIKVKDGNYIDIGRPVAGAIPVVVKTLIFNV